MNALSVSILFSGGNVKVTSTSSFSSSGLAGSVFAVFRSAADGRFVRVGLIATFSVASLATVGEACATGFSVVCGNAVGDGVVGAASGEATGVSEGWGDTEASGVAAGGGDATAGATVALGSGFGVSVDCAAGVSVARAAGVSAGWAVGVSVGLA